MNHTMEICDHGLKSRKHTKMEKGLGRLIEISLIQVLSEQEPGLFCPPLYPRHLHHSAQHTVQALQSFLESMNDPFRDVYVPKINEADFQNSETTCSL